MDDVIGRNLCNSCINNKCIFQSGMVRNHCDFYNAEGVERKSGGRRMRMIDADPLKIDIVEEGQRSRRYKLGEIWELNRDEIYKVIDEQPTIELEPCWIPCSERLPEDGTDCLVSVRCSKKVVVVDIATYSTDLFKVDKEDFFGNRGESGWYYLNTEYGYCKVLNVIAWMPLPEPYQEGQE